MADYLNDAQRQQVAQYLNSWTVRTQWPTWLLAVVIYGGWFLTLLFRTQLTLLPTTLLLIGLCAWFMSLQHEITHGHPTRHAWFNKLLGYAPLAVWFPYTLYRESHLQHHNDENLTLPGMDPETHYVDEASWLASGRLMQLQYRARKTFWGNMLVGPLMEIIYTIQAALYQIRQGDFRYVRMWLTHLSLLAVMLYVIQRYCDIAWWYYLLLIAYPALALALVRSYFEHRASKDCKQRIVINEAGWPLRLLFLNNNYHLVHHDLPRLPWYLIARVYRDNREAFLERSGHFHVRGYSEFIRDHGMTPIDDPIHPFGAATQKK